MPPISAPLRTASVLYQIYGDAPFSYRHVKLGGVVTVEALRGAVAKGHVVRVRRGEYQVAVGTADVQRAVGSHSTRLWAALAVTPSAIVSHHCAAVLHGLPEVGVHARAGIPSFTIPGNHHAHGDDMLISGSNLAFDEIVEIDGIAVTSIPRTAADLARQLGMPDGLVAFDAASRLLVARAIGIPQLADIGLEATNRLRDAVRDPALVRLVRGEFRQTIARMTNWNGVGWARIAEQHMNPAAESVLESISRWSMISADLPRPDVGVPMLDGDGRLRWLDFWWPDARVIGEADGAIKYESRDELIAEKVREDALRAVADGFVRWKWDEAVTRPQIMVRRIQRELSRTAGRALADPRRVGITGRESAG